MSSYNSFRAMRARCNNPNNNRYHLYGGRGIKVCDRWSSFAAFLKDMGEAPDGHTIERVDPDGDYCPENCVWATQEQQQQNRRNKKVVEFRGELTTYPELERRFELPRNIVRDRVEKAGMSVEEAIKHPKGKQYNKR